MASLCRSAAKSAISRALFSKTSATAKAVPSSFSSSIRGIHNAARVVSGIGSGESMSLMPLLSAIANARLNSSIAVDSSCWSWMSQGWISLAELPIQQPFSVGIFTPEFQYQTVMESSCVLLNQNSNGINGFKIMSPSSYHHHQPCIKQASLPWLDLRVFYVRVSKCEIDDSTPEFLTLNHIPLNRDTLLEVNGARASIYADGVTTLLRRDRLDKRSEEATFVSTDGVRVTGSVKFEVFDKDTLVISGILDMTVVKKSGVSSAKWIMDFESDMISGSGFLKGSQHTSPPKIEVYVAGCFAGSPIVLTKTLQFGPWKKLKRRGMLDTIPEYEANESLKDPPPANLSLQKWEELSQKFDEENGHCRYLPEYMEGEDGELSWFNAGVRVGVGIGLSVCLGLGVGVGLLARTYQGTTRRFPRRLL